MQEGLLIIMASINQDCSGEPGPMAATDLGTPHGGCPESAAGPFSY